MASERRHVLSRRFVLPAIVAAAHEVGASRAIVPRNGTSKLEDDRIVIIVFGRRRREHSREKTCAKGERKWRDWRGRREGVIVSSHDRLHGFVSARTGGQESCREDQRVRGGAPPVACRESSHGVAAVGNLLVGGFQQVSDF